MQHIPGMQPHSAELPGGGSHSAGVSNGRYQASNRARWINQARIKSSGQVAALAQLRPHTVCWASHHAVAAPTVQGTQTCATAEPRLLLQCVALGRSLPLHPHTLVSSYTCIGQQRRSSGVQSWPGFTVNNTCHSACQCLLCTHRDPWRSRHQHASGAGMQGAKSRWFATTDCNASSVLL